MPYITEATAGPITLEAELQGEREVDIDDRGAALEIRTAFTGTSAPSVSGLTVDLAWSFPPDNVVLGPSGSETDVQPSLQVVASPAAVGTPTMLNVKTGAFTATPPNATLPAATPGPKYIRATVAWELDEPDPDDPDVRVSDELTLQFVVATD